jgi:hypothetical protein
MLADAVTGADVGGVDYKHDADGDHYRPWLFVNGSHEKVGEPLPQLTMAVRAAAAALFHHSTSASKRASDH